MKRKPGLESGRCGLAAGIGPGCGAAGGVWVAARHFCAHRMCETQTYAREFFFARNASSV